MLQTKRDKVEKILLERFKGIVRPISHEDIAVINSFKDGTFGLSFLGLMLYANGYTLKGVSTNNPQGLRYLDGENIFGISYAGKEVGDVSGHIHIIAPRGKEWFRAVKNFIKEIRDIPEIPKTTIYIRYLNSNMFKQCMGDGFNPIEKEPWHPLAPSEDETHNRGLVFLDDIIADDETGNIIVKKLNGPRSKNFRKKTKGDYVRFQHFLERNKLRVEMVDSIKEYKQESWNLIKDFFDFLRKRTTVVSSTAEDYKSLINFFPDLKANKDFFSYIGFLKDKTGRINIPVSLFIGERLTPKIIALYATISLRDPSTLPADIDPVGYTGISSYNYINIFGILKKKCNVEYIDLGGSELESLDKAKARLGAKEQKTYWALYT